MAIPDTDEQVGSGEALLATLTPGSYFTRVDGNLYVRRASELQAQNRPQPLRHPAAYYLYQIPADHKPKLIISGLKKDNRECEIVPGRRIYSLPSPPLDVM